MASTVSSRKSSIKEELPSFTDSWLMNTPLTWHKKGKVVATKSRKNPQIPSSEWLLEAPVESSGTAERKNHYDVTEWLKTTEQKLVKELCKANEPCSGFEGCLSDINCKKSKKMDD